MASKIDHLLENHNLSDKEIVSLKELLNIEIKRLLSSTHISLQTIVELLDAQKFFKVDRKQTEKASPVEMFDVEGFIREKIQIETQKQVTALLQYLLDFSKTNTVILPPDELETQEGKEEGEFEEKEIIERSKFLMELLTELKYKYFLIEGKNTPQMVRKLSYQVFIIPEIKKIVLVNNEEGNTTFVLHKFEEFNNEKEFNQKYPQTLLSYASSIFNVQNESRIGLVINIGGTHHNIILNNFSSFDRGKSLYGITKEGLKSLPWDLVSVYDWPGNELDWKQNIKNLLLNDPVKPNIPENLELPKFSLDLLTPVMAKELKEKYRKDKYKMISVSSLVGIEFRAINILGILSNLSQNLFVNYNKIALTWEFIERYGDGEDKDKIIKELKEKSLKIKEENENLPNFSLDLLTPVMAKELKEKYREEKYKNTNLSSLAKIKFRAITVAGILGNLSQNLFWDRNKIVLTWEFIERYGDGEDKDKIIHDLKEKLDIPNFSLDILTPVMAKELKEKYREDKYKSTNLSSLAEIKFRAITVSGILNNLSKNLFGDWNKKALTWEFIERYSDDEDKDKIIQELKEKSLKINEENERLPKFSLELLTPVMAKELKEKYREIKHGSTNLSSLAEIKFIAITVAGILANLSQNLFGDWNKKALIWDFIERYSDGEDKDKIIQELKEKSLKINEENERLPKFSLELLTPVMAKELKEKYREIKHGSTNLSSLSGIEFRAITVAGILKNLSQNIFGDKNKIALTWKFIERYGDGENKDNLIQEYKRKEIIKKTSTI